MAQPDDQEGWGELPAFDYPIFTTRLTDKYFLVGGGGGKSRTGIKNGVSLFKYRQSPLQFKSVGHFSSDGAVMCSELSDSVIVGIDESIHVLNHSLKAQEYYSNWKW